MKKLLSLLGAIGLTATTGATVVACGSTTAKKDVANDVVTTKDYQIATQNIQPSTYAEGDLIANLDSHLRGYLNPLFQDLIGQNAADINDDYDIQGITEADIKKAMADIESGSAEKVQLSGISVLAKDNAKYLTGEVDLPTITLLEGSDSCNLNKLFANPNNIKVESDDYLPTLSEILDELNEELANSYPEPVILELGHFTHEVSGRGKVVISGNGTYYGNITINHESMIATDISKTIVGETTELGKMGFISAPTNDQIFSALTTSLGEDYNAENLEIASRNNTETKLYGKNKLKGEAVVHYEQNIFSLENIANKNLGALNEKPKDKADLVAQINKLNTGLGLTPELITLGGEIGDTSAYIAAVENSELVTDAAKIEWSIQQLDLGTIITTTDLGALAASTKKQDILDAVNAKNPGYDLILNKDVEIGDINNTENGRVTTISAMENSARYSGSVTVTWTIKPILSETNLQEAINKLKAEGKLNFEVKVGLSVEEAKAAITKEIKTLLEENYWLNSPDSFKIDFSAFPSDEDLAKPSGHFPWISQDAKMTFTLEENGKGIAVDTSWQITVIDTEKIDITLDWDKPSMQVGADYKIKVTNKAAITNLKIAVKDSSFATANLTGEMITITGIKVGTTELTLTGDNANTKTITITIIA